MAILPGAFTIGLGERNEEWKGKDIHASDLLGPVRKVNRCKGEGLELNSKEGFVFVRGGYKECAQDAS